MVGNGAILIVEDEMLLARSLELILTQNGHRVVGKADTLMRAVQIAEAERPAVALVDIRLRDGASGIDVARKLCTLGVLSLLMTGNRPAAPLPGIAVGCLSKPFSDGALLEALDVVVATRSGLAPPGELPPELELY